MKAKQFITTLLVGVALTATIAMSRQPPTTYAQHIVDEDVRMDIRTGIQPSQDDQGVTFSLAACEPFGRDVRYDLRVHNPYARELTGVGLLGFDGPGVGTLWGFVAFDVAAGSSRVVVDTTRFTSEARDRFLNGEVQELTHELVGCSFHFIGFQEGPDFAVDHPVRHATFT